MEERVYTTANGNVRYWVDAPASALPWMVLVPGLTADHTLFNPQLAYFAGKANLLVWDAPAHGASRPYPLNFTMDDYARIMHGILAEEGVAPGEALYVGQSFGGYMGQAYLDLFPGAFKGFVAIDSAPLQRGYYQAWELAALERTYLMYVSMPWRLLLRWGSNGCAETPAARANMRQMMQRYGKLEYCRLTAYGFRMLAQAIKANRPYAIDCPALLLCGNRDVAGAVVRYNRAWHGRAGIPLVWVPDAGHNANVDAPDFVNVRIAEFLAALG